MAVTILFAWLIHSHSTLLPLRSCHNICNRLFSCTVLLILNFLFLIIIWRLKTSSSNGHNDRRWSVMFLAVSSIFFVSYGLDLLCRCCFGNDDYIVFFLSNQSIMMTWIVQQVGEKLFYCQGLESKRESTRCVLVSREF